MNPPPTAPRAPARSVLFSHPTTEDHAAPEVAGRTPLPRFLTSSGEHVPHPADHDGGGKTA
ncbi:hypothetical protein [Actinokineospora inagensis]|uniref:hypothetical protein n=1 Tax=Actinokineospora inagensis TaxID=103730 RepID=UPI0004280440|nr:hypothetical protein [Actinokineospora inagensis]